MAAAYREAEFLIGRAQVELVGAQGQRLRSAVPATGYRRGPSDALAFFVLSEAGQSWLGLRVPRRAMDQFQGGPVTVLGQATVSFVGRGETTWIPVGGNAAVPGLGRCLTEEVARPVGYGEGMLKILCESVEPVASLTAARLWNPASGQSWNHHLGDSAPVLSGPREAWLSPLHRLQTYFQLAAGARTPMPGNSWLVPPEALEGARVAITPRLIRGSAALVFELRDVELGESVAPSVPGSGVAKRSGDLVGGAPDAKTLHQTVQRVGIHAENGRGAAGAADDASGPGQYAQDVPPLHFLQRVGRMGGGHFEDFRRRVGSFRGQEVRAQPEDRPLGEYEPALDDVLEFPDVAGPGVVHQELHRSGRGCAHRQVHAPRVFLQEEFDNARNIGTAVPQCRHVERNHVQAVVEI